jgi:hypothetical protein
LTIALAAAGCALVVYGALAIGGEELGGGDGDGSKVPGIALFVLVVAAGVALLAKLRTGPLATAGTVAAALGVPPLLFFLTFDEGSFPPYSTEAILVVSTVAWAVLYLLGPGAGRPFFLGAACIGLWLTVLQLAEDVFTFPFQLFEPFVGFGSDAGFDSDFDGGFGVDTPDPTTIGVLSLAFGAAYLWLARRWDRQGYAGAATPLTAAALVTIPVGIAFWAVDLEGTGTGVVGAVVGTVVAAHGASVGRRGATWLGAAGAALALVVLVADNIDSPTGAGVALIVVGGGVVAGAEALRRATNEPDEVPAGLPTEF